MKLIEQELNVLSSSEIRVALLPVGVVPEDVLHEYQALVLKYCHVRLSTVRSFHHEKEKSPFKQLPWSKGCLNFRFLTSLSMQPSSLSCLYASRAVLGVIGLCHCPSSPDIPQAYAEFENLCKQFPNSVTLRCFAFHPVNEEMVQNGRQKEHLIMFPECEPAQLEHHAEVLMHDFAACLLMELQQGMLNLSVGMMSLSTIVDQPDVFGYSGATDEVPRRQGTEEEVRLRRRHTRMQKLFGDWSMLAGSPRDAFEHYSTCVELSRYCGDALWGAAAVEGMAEAKVLEALIEQDAIPKRDPIEGTDMVISPSMNGVLSSLRPRRSSKASVFDECSIGYGDQRMWKTIRSLSDLLNQVLAFYAEAETVYSARGILPLQIEVQMKSVRLLIAMKGHDAKATVNTTTSRIMEHWPKLKSEFDRMNVVVEVSKILKVMELHRKRAFLIWQALDSVHLMQTSDVALISLALQSELSSDALEMQRSVKYLTQDVFTSPHWSALHKAMAEAILPTASKAGMEIIVWESAATLLREFYSDIPQERQQMLMDVLKRASTQMAASDKTRNTLGPPPYFQVRNIGHLAEHLKPHICDELMDKSQTANDDDADSAFIFNPYAAKRKSDAKQEQQQMSRWSVGEECSLEVYISNPCSVQLKIERLCLCVEEKSDEAPRATPVSVAVVLPAKIKPTRVSLGIVPHFAGPLRLIGCHVTLYGVTWLQRFVTTLRKVPRLPGLSIVDPEWGNEKNMVVEIDVISSMPLLKWQFLSIDSDKMWPASLEETTRTGEAATQQEKAKVLKVNIRAGERLDFKLRITNVSQFPVLKVKLMPECTEKPSAGQDPVDGEPLCTESDETQLMQKLPMSPNDIAELPVRVLAGHKAAASGLSANKDILAQVRLLYSGPQDDPPSKSAVFGRELLAPLSFRILPSANIISIQISQHFVPILVPSLQKSATTKSFSRSDRSLSISRSDSSQLGRSSDDSQTENPTFSRKPSSRERSDSARKMDEIASGEKHGEESRIRHFHSECVIKATIANNDTQVLCVWVGETPDGTSFHQPQWIPPAAPASHSVVPGQAVQVSCRIPAMPLDQTNIQSTDIEATACEWMRSTLCGFWQSVVHQPTFTEHDESPSNAPDFALGPSYGSQGTIPIKKDHIARVITPALLASVVQAYVMLSVHLADSCTKDFVNLKEVLSLEGDLSPLMESRLIDDPEAEWTIQAPEYDGPSLPGQALQESTSVRCDMPSTPKGPNGEVWGIQTEVGEFLSCEMMVENHTGRDLDDVSFTIYSERIDEAAEGSDILFRRENGLHHAGLQLIGRTANIPYPSSTTGTSFTHKFGVCCVMPGLYHIYVCEKVPDSHALTESFVQGFRLNIACK